MKSKRYKKNGFTLTPKFGVTLYSREGLTLIELLVAMAIFIVVISVVINLFTISLRGQRKVVASQNLQDNAKYLLGFMAKEIRMSQINSVASTTLGITRSDGEDITYFFDGTNIQRTVVGDPSSSGPINSDEVLITGSFYGLGIGKGDNQQARVTIVIKIETIGTKPEEKAEINLQTTLCQRGFDIQ